MGAIDIVVVRFFFNFSLPFLAFVAVLFVLIPRISKYRARSVSSFLLKLEETYDRVSESSLKKLFSPLHSMQSQDWHLRNVGLIRILVINPKTGEIFKYFPRNSHVVVHDRNVHSLQFLRSELGTERRKNVQIESLFIGHPENMSQVRTSSVDAVVATRVLCSSRNVSRVLSEIHRVLAPGGKFFFMEHTQDTLNYRMELIKTILTKSWLWPLFTHNCHLNSCPEVTIQNCPYFEETHMDYLRLSVTKRTKGKRISWLFRLKPLYVFGNCAKRSSRMVQASECDQHAELDKSSDVESK